MSVHCVNCLKVAAECTCQKPKHVEGEAPTIPPPSAAQFHSGHLDLDTRPAWFPFPGMAHRAPPGSDATHILEIPLDLSEVTNPDVTAVVAVTAAMEGINTYLLRRGAH